MTRTHNVVREFVIPVSVASAAALPATILRLTGGSTGSLGSVFALALLLQWRLSLWGAIALTVLFVTQLGLAFSYQTTPEKEIAVLTAMAWVYLTLGAVFLIGNARQLPTLWLSAWRVHGPAHD